MKSSIAILPDFKEENWPSMDLVAEKLIDYLPGNERCQLDVHGYQPNFQRLASAVPVPFRAGARFNADRLWNRFVAYPRQARRLTDRFDLFHVADHTYAALVHALPPERTGVYCHDLDAFRSLIEPELEPRSWWFRKMAGRILSGMQKAAVVFHSTMPVRETILKHGLIDESKLVHAPYGVAEEFCLSAQNGNGLTEFEAKGEAEGREPSGFLQRDVTGGLAPSRYDTFHWLEELQGQPWIAHVGSCIPRKRIDVLLDVVAGVKKAIPQLKLVKIGGEFSDAQTRQIDALNLKSTIIHRSGIDRRELAEVYRHAGAVLMTSDSEGFGLPVIEALACGAPVIASDIPVLREVGQAAAIYCPVANIPAWIEVVVGTIRDSNTAPDLSTRIRIASQYTWQNHANIIAEAYGKMK